MKKQIKLVALAILLFIACNDLNAQTGIDEFTDTYFTLLEKSPEKAFDFLTKDIKVRAGQESTENMKKQILFAASQSGVFYGHEKIMERSIGSSLKLLSFLLKYEKDAARLTTIFYKPADQWILFEYRFDANLVQELKESAKLSSVQE